MRLRLKLAAFAIGMVIVLIYAIILAFPVMWLWNYTAVGVLGVREMNFWQSLCMLILTGILFRNSSSSSSSSSK